MKNSILEKARWLREVALATSKNNGARVAREWLKYAAMFVMLFTIGVGNARGEIAAGTYELCTSTSDLVASGHYIIASSTSDGTAYAIANTLKSDNRATVSVTVASKKISIAANSTVMTFTLGGDNTNGWTFSTDNYTGDAGMLAATSSKNNRLGVVASPGDNGKWAITFSSDLAKPVAKGTYTRKYMKYNYNSGKPIFNCYSSSGSESLYIYKLAASCDNKVTISKGSETNGTFTLDKTGEQNACDALSVTITPSPAEHFHVASVSATNPATTGTAGGAVDKGDGTWTITYSANSKGASTINVTFEADQQYTVNWYVNGSIAHSQTGYEGATLTGIPTPTSSDCDGSKVFVGWYTSTYSHASTAPAYVSPTTIPNGGANYYAVFADATPSTDYEQITAKGDLVAGAKYLIVGYNSSVYKALPVDAATSLTTVTVSSSTISNPGSTLIWTLEGSADAWKIKSTNNNKYLQISSGSLTFENSTSLTFSVGVSSNVFTFTSSATSGNKVLSYYAIQNKFNAYTKANTVYVFKQKITYSNYEVNCCNTPTLTFAASPYAVLREDLGGASTTTWAEVDVTFTSNSTGTISAAQYSNATVTNGTAYQLAASKWQEYETTGGTLCGAAHAYFEVLTQPSGETPGTGKFHVKTSSGQTGQGTYRIAITQEGTDESHGNYCETTVYGFVDVTLRDKFVDNVNGNGTVTRDGHGAQLATPTLSEFGTQEEDACHSEGRKLKGWIKETDLKAQYETGSSTRVQTVDGLCETCADGTDQTSLIVAPGTNVTMSGATWYAVWAYER